MEIAADIRWINAGPREISRHCENVLTRRNGAAVGGGVGGEDANAPEMLPSLRAKLKK